MQWRVPYPHEVFAALMAFCGAAVAGHLFPADSVWTHLCEVGTLMFGGGGIAAGVAYKTPRLRQVLEQHDQQVNAKIAAGGNPPEPPRAA